jgi:hypothetical protein
MNPIDTMPTAQQRQRVNAYLHGLVDAEPPAALQQRVLSAIPATRSGWRPARIAAWGSAMAAAGLAALALFAVRDDASMAPPATLETQASAPVQWQLRALDRELQLALQRGADENQLAVLWAERQAVVAQLDSPRPAAPVRM